MRLLTVVLAGLFFSLSSFCQSVSITVAGQRFDDNLVQAIKQLQPDFGLGGDSAEIVSKVLKFYSSRKYVAELAHSKKIDTIDELASKLATARKIMEEKMVAEYYASILISGIAVSDAESRKYYEQEKKRYSTSGKCDVIYIETSDTSMATIAGLRKFAEESALLPEQERMSLKKYNDVYFIKNYQIYTDNQQYPFLKEIFSAKLKSWIGPMFSKDINRYVYYFIISRREEIFTPYESVKEMCIQNLRSQKSVLLTEQWNQDALKKYPIQIAFPSSVAKDSVKIFYH